MALRELAADNVDPLDNVGADEEESRLEARGLEVVERAGGGQVEAVVEGDGPGVVGLAVEQVVGVALVAPPTAANNAVIFFRRGVIVFAFVSRCPRRRPSLDRPFLQSVPISPFD